MRDQPGALRQKQQQQHCRQNLRFAEPFMGEKSAHD
jgi:hypothetical protein